MTDKSVEQKPSETALFAALRRTIAHKEYNNERFGPDNLAEYFLPLHFRFFLKFKRIQANTRDKLNGFLPGLNEYMIARTAYFDRLFIEALKDETPQIVLLGAGYDSRAYRLAKANQVTRIFELDIPPTQERKKQCLKKARIDISNQVLFVPINFNRESIKDTLAKAGYQHNQKTLFIWEGVTYYLEKGAVENTLTFVSRGSNPESSIALDYTISINEENIDQYYGVRDFSNTMREQHSDEGLMFSIPQGEIGSFLESRELKMIKHLDNEAIEREFLVDEDGSLIGKITGHFRFVQASPIKKF